MKTKKSTRYGIIAIAMVMLIAWCGLPVWAQDHDDEDGDGGIEWGLLLGGGGLIMPKYLGSDEMEFQPVPFIDASLEIGFVELFLNAEKGAGVSLELGESVPVAFSLGVTVSFNVNSTAYSSSILSKAKCQSFILTSESLSVPIASLT